MCKGHRGTTTISLREANKHISCVLLRCLKSADLLPSFFMLSIKRKEFVEISVGEDNLGLERHFVKPHATFRGAK